MELYRFFVLLSLACSCTAGPIVAGIAIAAEAIADEVAAAAVAGSSMAAAFGVGTSAVWFGPYIIIDGALFYGTGAVAGEVIVGAGKLNVFA